MNGSFRAHCTVTAFFVVAFLASLSLRADVSLPPVFGDHMVLQRGMEIPVWGSARPVQQLERH